VPGAQAILPPLPGTPPGQGWWTGGGIDGRILGHKLRNIGLHAAARRG
jgi:hypothetical protein